MVTPTASAETEICSLNDLLHADAIAARAGTCLRMTSGDRQQLHDALCGRHDVEMRQTLGGRTRSISYTAWTVYPILLTALVVLPLSGAVTWWGFVVAEVGAAVACLHYPVYRFWYHARLHRVLDRIQENTGGNLVGERQES